MFDLNQPVAGYLIVAICPILLWMIYMIGQFRAQIKELTKVEVPGEVETKTEETKSDA